MTPDRRRELERILASEALRVDARQGDAEARRTIEEARDELRALDKHAEREVAT